MKCYVERTDPARNKKGEVIRIIVEIDTSDPNYKHELADIYARCNINESRLGNHAGYAESYYKSDITNSCSAQLGKMMRELGTEEGIRRR